MNDTEDRFAALQNAFLERVRSGGPGELSAGTVVVVPSITFPESELRKIVGIEFYEERCLFALLQLRDPSLRIVYVTSMPVAEDIVSYYLSFLDDPERARARLRLVSVSDPRPTALTEKLLKAPAAIDDLRSLIEDPEHSYMYCFNVTRAEQHLATLLGIPVFGPHPDLAALGSKSGARGLAREVGVPVLEGAEDLYSTDEVAIAIEKLRSARSDARSVVIKLNNGFSGQGNAIVPLDGFRFPLVESPTVFCAGEESWPTYSEKILGEGAVVEAHVRRAGMTSPSVQMRILPGGHHEVLSTHDQILGGPDDQVYLGCRFPAHADYRAEIQDHSRKLARALADAGVIGSFGIDFVVVPGEGSYMSEINLRLGGTTHPFLMTKLVTGSNYDSSSGELRTDGHAKYYVASDNLKSPAYKGLTPREVIDHMRARGLLYDPAAGRGATLHLLGALPGYGKVGAVAIADSPEEAGGLYEDIRRALDHLAASSPSAR